MIRNELYFCFIDSIILYYSILFYYSIVFIFLKFHLSIRKLFFFLFRFFSFLFYRILTFNEYLVFLLIDLRFIDL